MLGCPHNSIEQMELIAHLLERQEDPPGRAAVGCHAPRHPAGCRTRSGYCDIISAAGGVVMSDTCPAILAAPAAPRGG